jgi:hypothetical protein
MKNRLRFAAIAVAVAVPMTGLSAGVAQAENIGSQGCTPGYWKNHTENWEEYRPTTQLRYIFKQTARTSFGTVTLADALSLRGGPGADGASQILLRAATAAVLNAAHEDVGYPYRRFTQFQIIAQVDAALASGDRATMLALAALLDKANNLGCPLN